MSIILFLLSIGVIYSFIPIVIIVILILAARGSQWGDDFFKVFTISTVLSFSKGIGKSGVGKAPFSQKYRSNKTKIKKAAVTVGKAFSPIRPSQGALYKAYKSGVKEERVSKLTSMKNMSESETRQMLLFYGYGNFPNMAPDTLKLYATSVLSVSQIDQYANSIGKKSGTPQPPRPPGKVKMSTRLSEYYKNYYKTSGGNARLTRPPIFVAGEEEREKGYNLQNTVEGEHAPEGEGGKGPKEEVDIKAMKREHKEEEKELGKQHEIEEKELKEMHQKDDEKLEKKQNEERENLAKRQYNESERMELIYTQELAPQYKELEKANKEQEEAKKATAPDSKRISAAEMEKKIREINEKINEINKRQEKQMREMRKRHEEEAEKQKKLQQEEIEKWQYIHNNEIEGLNKRQKTEKKYTKKQNVVQRREAEGKD